MPAYDFAVVAANALSKRTHASCESFANGWQGFCPSRSTHLKASVHCRQQRLQFVPWSDLTCGRALRGGHPGCPGALSLAI
jgi:hypothetical protein